MPKPQRIVLNSAKSFIGKSINLHFSDGDVLVNVFLEGIENKSLLVRDNKRRGRTRYVPLCKLVQITTVPLVAKMLKERS